MHTMNDSSLLYDAQFPVNFSIVPQRSGYIKPAQKKQYPNEITVKSELRKISYSEWQNIDKAKLLEKYHEDLIFEVIFYLWNWRSTLYNFSVIDVSVVVQGDLSIFSMFFE